LGKSPKQQHKRIFKHTLVGCNQVLIMFLYHENFPEFEFPFCTIYPYCLIAALAALADLAALAALAAPCRPLPPLAVLATLASSGLQVGGGGNNARQEFKSGTLS
jgi:hypothetical protein